MIRHITKQFSRSYIMSPRIVLLFLGLVITICEAAVTVTVSKPTISYSPTTGKLSCAFVASMVTNEICFSGQTTGCKVKFYLGADTTPVHTSPDDTHLDYTPTRNGVYTCIAFKGTDDSVKSDPPSDAVDDLVNTPTFANWTPIPTCGKKDMTLTCNADNGSGVSTKNMRVVKKGDATTVAFDAQTTAITKTFTPFVTADRGVYYCEAAIDEHGAKMARSNPIDLTTTNGCTDCTDNTTCTSGTPDHSKRTYCNDDKECVDPTPPPTPAPSTSAAPGPDPSHNPNPDSTSNGSGGGGDDDKGSTKSDNGNKGDDSGASDLGRPASVLTIVCSLLPLTLNLRG